MLAPAALLSPSHRVPARGRRRHRVAGPRLVNPAWVDEVEAIRHPCSDDEAGLRRAIDFARENVLHGTGGPFGAVVVDAGSGEVVSAGVNGVELLQDSVAHAEIVALVTAEARLGTYSLAPGSGRYTLYASSEPCAMCLGAILWSGISRVVYAARREDAEAIGFDEGPVLPGSTEYLAARGITVEQGPLRDEAAAVLQRYAERGGTIYNGFGPTVRGNGTATMRTAS